MKSLIIITCPGFGTPIESPAGQVAKLLGSLSSAAKKVSSRENAKKPRPNAVGKKKPQKPPAE
jgi:hypothetical protein